MSSFNIVNIKRIQKEIDKNNFKDAYKHLFDLEYNFSFDNLTKDFPKIDSIKMYAFLMYAVSQNEVPELHLSICYYLYFMEPYIIGADVLIKWHLNRILEISPCNRNVLDNWILGIYNGNPDNPFTDEELCNIQSYQSGKGSMIDGDKNE